MIRTRSSLGEDGRRERGYERKDRQSLGRQRTAPLSNRPRITVQRPGCECILSRRLSPPRSAPLWHASSAAAAHRSQSPVLRKCSYTRKLTDRCFPSLFAASARRARRAPPQLSLRVALHHKLSAHALSARASLGDGRNEPIASTRRAASRAGLLPSVCSHRIGCGRPIDEW